MMHSRIVMRCVVLPFAALGAVLCVLYSAAPALATVGWTVRAVAEPTHFSSSDVVRCASEGRCDRYQLLVMNAGDVASSGTIMMTDTLPPGITTRSTPLSGRTSEGVEWRCTEGTGNTTVTCTLEGSIPAGGYAPFIDVEVSAPAASASGSLKNEVSVTGGGTTTIASASEEPTPISSQAPEFGVDEFGFEVDGIGGGTTLQAGAHPWEVTTTLAMPVVDSSPSIESGLFTPVENVKRIAVELPAGFIGDPQAVPQCTQTELTLEACPAGSRVGAFAVRGGRVFAGEFEFTGAEGKYPLEGGCCSAVYNMVPEGGYAAEFAFNFASVPVYLYASVVHDNSGYHVRIVSPGVPAQLEMSGVAITFYGDPGGLNGGSSETAFLTNPANCSAGPLLSEIELESWEDPGHPVFSKATVYPQLTGCNLLHFKSSLKMAPSPTGPGSEEEGSTQADAPSAYTTELAVPQTSSFSELATPELKDVTVALPAGLSVSPSAGQGLVGCDAEGPEGINIGSNNIGPGGQDLGDPEATELGAGHAGGNGSPYDDGFYHTAKGHCPEASTLGTVEVFTPLLPTRCGGEGQPACKPGESLASLQGHVYLAAPRCGGSGQPECTEASATNGELFGLYIEVEGSGVIVKLPGTVAANPQTGQLTATFKENPQLPFSDLKLHFHGGPRAPLANPQGCGSFATTSTLTSWGGQEASGSSPAFSIDWDGKGAACPASLPFSPGFSAGTTSPAADAFSPFVLTFSRQDREQDLSGLSVTLPPGLLAKIAGIPLCEEGPANAGTCGPESQIGAASVLAGPGTNPLYVSGGRVYLTTGYKGQPFGLSIVVPAVAGPFNLGDVVVRASIHIDPNTAQVTVMTDPLPQSRDGVPFRLRRVYTEINRPGGVTFNPTNCAQQQITGTITGAPVKSGEAAVSTSVSNPFAATGCAALPFKPSFTASTSGTTSKADGASLVVKVAQTRGEANIQKVDLTLPKVLPVRLTTLQKACIEAQFNANPAGCPEASVIGTATANTSVLPVPLTGPAYLVSHGGAAFPDVEFILQGDGVEIVLDGKTDIKHGVTYSKFETVPDAPISSFETNLPEGPHSALAATGNLCATTTTKTVSVKKRVTVRVRGRAKRVTKMVKRTVTVPASSLLMPTTITGQNGGVITQNTKISVTGCAATKPVVNIKKVKVNGNAVLVTVTTTQRGTVTASGRGLKTLKRTLGAGAHQLRVALTKSGKAARRRRRTTRIKVSVKNPVGSSNKSVTFKL